MGKVAVALRGVSVAVKIAFVVLWVITASLLYVNKVYAPPRKFTLPQGMDSLEACKTTTENLDDLIVRDELSQDEAEQLANTHGMAIVPSVLKKETAHALREFILKANLEMGSACTDCHAPENRYLIMPPLTEPTMQQAFKEIAEHPVLRPLVDRLLGPSASLVDMSALTSIYGAENQDWHHDGGTNHAVYPDLFVRTWGVAVALQDTTAEMGATGICPGTHECSWPDSDDCPLQAVLGQGDGFLYDEIIHRGSAHVDPDAPERVMLFVTFAGSRQGPKDERMLPLGDMLTLPWNMWGHTIDDFANMKERPWRMWHAFGLFHQAKRNVRPWNLIDSIIHIFRDEIEAAEAIGPHFTHEYLEDLTNDLVCRVGIATAIFFLLRLMLMGFNHWKSIRVNIVQSDKKNKTL